MNPYSPPSVERNPQLSRLRWLPRPLVAGLAVYGLRAILVYLHSRNVISVGGPGSKDPAIMAWLPFFVVDFPWSAWFDKINFQSDKFALFAYIFFVGIPWICYGAIATCLIGRIQRKRRSDDDDPQTGGRIQPALISYHNPGTPPIGGSASQAESRYMIGSQNPFGPTASPTHVIIGNPQGVQFNYGGIVNGSTGVEMTTRAKISVIRVEPIKE
jgi:hypothetical protein